MRVLVALIATIAADLSNPPQSAGFQTSAWTTLRSSPRAPFFFYLIRNLARAMEVFHIADIQPSEPLKHAARGKSKVMESRPLSSDTLYEQHSLLSCHFISHRVAYLSSIFYRTQPKGVFHRNGWSISHSWTTMLNEYSGLVQFISLSHSFHFEIP